MDFIHSCKDSVNVSNTSAKQRGAHGMCNSKAEKTLMLFRKLESAVICPVAFVIRVLRWLHSPGRGSLSFLPFLSTLCFHPPCFIGGLSGSPADTTACLVSRFARDDGASGRQSKISPIPPGLPENSTEARFAAQHTRGRVRVSLWSTRLRSSGGAGSEGTPRKARPIRGDGTTSGRSRHTLVRAHADHACATHTSACRSRVRNADMVSGGVAHPGRCSCGALWAPAQKRANVAPPSFPS